jgi:hypothetical protein
MCNCIITYDSKNKHYVRFCLSCESSGGSYGNINHQFDCKYRNCRHKIHSRASCEPTWTTEEAKCLQITNDYHSNLSQKITNEINKRYCHLVEKVRLVIMKKTNRLILWK